MKRIIYLTVFVLAIFCAKAENTDYEQKTAVASRSIPSKFYKITPTEDLYNGYYKDYHYVQRHNGYHYNTNDTIAKSYYYVSYEYNGTNFVKTDSVLCWDSTYTRSVPLYDALYYEMNLLRDSLWRISFYDTHTDKLIASVDYKVPQIGKMIKSMPDTIDWGQIDDGTGRLYERLYDRPGICTLKKLGADKYLVGVVIEYPNGTKIWSNSTSYYRLKTKRLVDYYILTVPVAESASGLSEYGKGSVSPVVKGVKKDEK